MLTWLRLSTLRQLDWYRNSNYQSKDIAHVQKSIAQRMADKVEAGQLLLFSRCVMAVRVGQDGMWDQTR